MSSKLTLFVTIFLVSAVSAGSVRWSSSGALQVAVPDALHLTIRPAGDPAPDLCSQFRTALSTLPTDKQRAKRTFDARRKAAPSAAQPTFSLEFQTGALSSPGLLQIEGRQLATEALSARALTSSPELIHWSTSIELPQTTPSSVRLEFNPGSLSAFADELGLEPLRIEVRLYQGALTFKVRGIDTACDLLEGNARLVSKGRAIAHLEDSGVRALRHLTVNMREELNPLLSGSGSNTRKALAMGFRWNEAFSEAQQKNLLPVAEDTSEQAFQFLERMMDMDQLKWRSGWQDSLIGQFPDSFEIRDINLHFSAGAGQ